jgi:hypothetical protein
VDTKYTINEIWSRFTILGMGMYGYYGKYKCMGVIPAAPREGYPLPKPGWVQNNKVVYLATPRGSKVEVMSDRTLDAVMKAIGFNRDLYCTLHFHLGINVEIALMISPT